MMIVPSPQAPPHRCAVTGRSEDQGGFVDTGNTLPSIDPRIYISRQGVVLLNEKFGLPDPARHAQVIERAEQLADRVLELEEQLAAANAQLDAVAVLKRYGTKVERKPGRPRKPQQQAA